MSENPYDRPSDPAKRNSAVMTDGPERAAARAMLKAIGFTDEDLARPFVGVATTWIETMPCNFNQRALAQKVKQGIREAGGTPIEFNTISVSDGVTMGVEGMRGSLVSREVIADSIELATRSHHLDGLVCLVGCDKTIPAAAMALARMDIPGLVFYNGSIAPGRYDGHDVTIQDVFEGVGRYLGGSMTGAELHALESAACPGAGACGGMFTANTMATALDFLGISPAALSGIPATNERKAEAALAAGRLVMDVVRRDLRPSQLITREALENAAACVAATGGSTNGVLHLIAIARELGIDFGLDDFERVAERTPIVASLKPGGQFVATDMYEAGGIGLVARELRKRDLIHAGAPERRGRHARRPGRRRRGDAGPAGRRLDRAASQAHRRARDPLRQPRARGLRRQALGPRAHASQRPGARLRLRGRLLRGRQGAHAQEGRRRRASATRARPAARACARCCTSPRPSWARVSARTSR